MRTIMFILQIRKYKSFHATLSFGGSCEYLKSSTASTDSYTSYTSHISKPAILPTPALPLMPSITSILSILHTSTLSLINFTLKKIGVE